jgi:hypothetical protein
MRYLLGTDACKYKLKERPPALHFAAQRRAVQPIVTRLPAKKRSRFAILRRPKLEDMWLI